jgi:Mrp family chromosome partitioning ATPase
MSEEQEEMFITQKLVVKRTPTSAPDLLVVDTPEDPLPTNGQATHPKSNLVKNREVANAQMLQEQCLQLCLSVFFRENAPVRSLGFTSSISGEGKSFLAMIAAEVLANDSISPVTLLECDWEHPSLAEYFGFPAVPGLAEWLRNECSEAQIRNQSSHNLTIIPAGNKKQGVVKLLQQIRLKGGFVHALSSSNELLIVDLPAITTTGYGSLAASLVESLMVVVRAGVTSDLQVAETCRRLKDLPVQGIMLNQVQSRIPRWIQQLLS